MRKYDKNSQKILLMPRSVQALRKWLESKGAKISQLRVADVGATASEEHTVTIRKLMEFHSIGLGKREERLAR